jgi:two-component system, NarL family, invasion response regulator UvrY
MDSRIRVLVADDHVEVRAHIVQHIGRAADMVVTADAGDGFEAIERFLAAGADVVLLDLTMPRKGGIDTLRELLDIDPDVRVLLVSMHPPEQLERRVIRAGARGYLGKDRLGECLHHAIRTLHAGGIYLDPLESENARPNEPERVAASSRGG